VSAMGESEVNERGRECMRREVRKNAFAREVYAFAWESSAFARNSRTFAREVNALVDEISTCALHICKRCAYKGRKRTCDW
jgi:hypothetical protein